MGVGPVGSFGSNPIDLRRVTQTMAEGIKNLKEGVDKVFQELKQYLDEMNKHMDQKDLPRLQKDIAQFRAQLQKIKSMATFLDPQTRQQVATIEKDLIAAEKMLRSLQST